MDQRSLGWIRGSATFRAFAGAVAIAAGVGLAVQPAGAATAGAATARPAGRAVVSAGLTVSGLSPAEGVFYGGTHVVITGTGFSTSPGVMSFSFGTNPDTGEPNTAVDVSCSSSTTCSALTPFAPSGPQTGSLDLLASDGTTTSSPNSPDDLFSSAVGICNQT
jgi:IPT/TIG domain